MKKFYLKVKKLKEQAKIDPPAKLGDVGFDVYATTYKELKPGERYAMPLGIAMEFPEGYGAFVEQRSGLARKKGILTIGNVIDSGYRGECHAIIVNTSNDEEIAINAGDKIAQIVFHPCPTVGEIEYVEELSQTERGGKGFGSTGV
jgi:dUTP pyrophosphatase